MERQKLTNNKMASFPSSFKDKGENFAAIVKVNKAGYVPDGLKVRSRISNYIFTADVPAGTLESISRNPSVVSIAPSQKQKMIK